MNQQNDPEQPAEDAPASEPAEDSSAPQATDAEPTEAAEDHQPATAEPRRSSKGPWLVSILALILAGAALAWPWLQPYWQPRSADTPAEPSINPQALESDLEQQSKHLQELLESQQSIKQQQTELIDRLETLQQDAESQIASLQERIREQRREIDDDINNQSQRALERIELLSRQLQRMEETWLSLRGELETLKERETPRQHGWQLQEVERLLRRAEADWALQADTGQALVALRQVETLLEDVSAAGVGGLRDRLAQHRSDLEDWVSNHPDPATQWQLLRQQLSELGWQARADQSEEDTTADEDSSWTERISSGFGKLVRIERDSALEPELWDLQARESLQLLMHQELLLAERAHRRDSAAENAHAARLNAMLLRYFADNNAEVTAFRQQLAELVASMSPQKPPFDELAERARSIREAMESGS